MQGATSAVYKEVHARSTQQMSLLQQNRGVAQLGLERLLGVQEIGGSNPLAPTIFFS
jgi:hypothetical protein